MKATGIVRRIDDLLFFANRQKHNFNISLTYHFSFFNVQVPVRVTNIMGYDSRSSQKQALA